MRVTLLPALWSVLLVVQAPAQESRRSDPRALARVTGRVLDDAGRPIAGAGFTVGPAWRLMTEDALARPAARSGADGSFSLPLPALGNDDPDAMLGFLVAAPGKAALRWAYGRGPHAPGRRHGEATESIDDLRLPEGVEIRGQVRGKAGRPLAGARIRAVDLLGAANIFANEPQFLSACTSGADGTFMLPCALASGLQLHVDAEGHYDRVLAPVNAKEPIVVELLESGFVEGKVLASDGKPFPCVVTLQYETSLTGLRSELTHRRGSPKRDSITPCQQVVARADGSFRATVRFPGSLEVRAGPARGPLEIGGELLLGPKKDVVLRFENGAERGLPITAKDGAGRVVDGFRALVLWKHGSLANPQDLARICGMCGVDADAAGVARVLGPGPEDDAEGLVYVEADGFAPFTSPRGMAKWDPKGRLEVRLDAEAVVAGRVLDAESRAPIAGAEVRCQRSVPSDGMAIPPEFVTRVRTADDGSFAIGGLGGGPHELVANAPGRPESETIKATLASGKEAGGLELLVGKGITLAGKVKAPPGDALRVRLERETTYPATGNQPERKWFARAAEADVLPDGSFAFSGQPPGRYQLALVVACAARQRTPRVVRLAPFDAATSRTDLEADGAVASPCTIAGRVAAKKGALPPGRLFVYTSPAPIGRSIDWLQRRPLEGPQGRAVLDSSGAFAIRTTAGKHHLVVADLVTGCILYRQPAPLECGPGATVRVDAVADFRQVLVGISREGNEHAVVSDVQIERGAVDPAAAGPRIPGLGSSHDGTLWVGDGTESFTLLLPMVPVTLVAKSGLGFLLRKPGLRGELGKVEVAAGEEAVRLWIGRE